ncbi:helix-turn-helix domain-containing protein [Streptomyces sp. NPDC005195]|uniref:helix-turn-helix domain-containing protein n=1 Tax=Streptomyces sp. NPDC005195 TaxID=3154561 RepID=UPI0033B5A126
MRKLATFRERQYGRHVTRPRGARFMEQPEASRPDLSVAQVARRLGKHPATVYRWIKNGELDAVRDERPCTCRAGVRSGAIRIPVKALETFEPAAATR